MKYTLIISVVLIPFIGYGFQALYREKRGLFSGGAACSACSFLLNAVITQRRLGASAKSIEDQLHFFCNIFNLDSPRVCEGAIALHAKIFLYMMDNDARITGGDMCGVIMQKNNCPTHGKEWHVNIPPKLPNKIYPEKSANQEKLKILHLTDIHYDPFYSVGSNPNCGEPVCCQNDQSANESGKPCGYWSDYGGGKVDIPSYLISHALEEMKKHEYDFVYFTGDIITHRAWDTSVERNSNDIKYVLKQLREAFTVPVYPILGNHESHPVSVWPPLNVTDDSLSMQWLFDLAADEWTTWLPEDTKVTIRKGGYYTVSPKPGFRIVALNSNVCYINNWWLIYDNVDPYGQLQWLVNVLTQAEENLEKVHILSHVPVGDQECHKDWSREYGRIIQRFSDTISGQFNGHSHFDEFEVFFNESEPQQAIAVAFNGGSLTTYEKVNPSFKIYQADGENFELLDYEEWTFNLTEANEFPDKTLNWYKLYQFTEAYKTKDLSPSEVAELVFRMAQDRSLVDKYYQYKYRNADPFMKKGCDQNCQKDLLCSMVTTQFGENFNCNMLRQVFTRLPG